MPAPDGFAALPGALTHIAAVLFAAMTALWLVSIIRRDASLIDLAWGSLYVVAAWAAWLYHHEGTLRAPWVVACVTLWGLRLSLYLTWRNAGAPEDRRYAAMRAKRPGVFWLWSLVFVFWLQTTLALIISLPVVAAIVASDPGAFSWIDAAAIACWSVGVVLEATADAQLARFRASPRDAGAVLDTGLWRYSRHPNYFGDALVWLGFGLFGVAAGAWWSFVGPALMVFLLLRVSGVALLERDLTDRRPAYRAYIARTSPFIPWPPRTPPNAAGERNPA